MSKARFIGRATARASLLAAPILLVSVSHFGWLAGLAICPVVPGLTIQIEADRLLPDLGMGESLRPILAVLLTIVVYGLILAAIWIDRPPRRSRILLGLAWVSCLAIALSHHFHALE